MEYTVLDENGEDSGSLEMVICNDYAVFSKVMNFDSMPGGFQFFEKQLPTRDIYPIAVLEWLETKLKNKSAELAAMLFGHFVLKRKNTERD